jgi:hypothetical protein
VNTDVRWRLGLKISRVQHILQKCESKQGGAEYETFSSYFVEPTSVWKVVGNNTKAVDKTFQTWDETVPEDISALSSLRELNLRYCLNLTSLSESFGAIVSRLKTYHPA